MKVGLKASSGRENLKVVQAKFFNFKLGCFTKEQHECVPYTWPLLKLKTRPRFVPGLGLGYNQKK
jgi:hypothetical protein